MKLSITILAGTALIALAGCNRLAPANNSAGNASVNATETTPPAADAGAKPGADAANSAAPADSAAPGGEKPAAGATETSSEDQAPEQGGNGGK